MATTQDPVALGKRVAAAQGFDPRDSGVDWAAYGRAAEYRISRRQAVPSPRDFGARGATAPPHPPAARRHSVQVGPIEMRLADPARTSHQRPRRQGERTTGRFRTMGASLYADPGYQYDGKPRYPLDTIGRVHNAWARIHQRRLAMRYTPHELRLIESAIRAQARRDGITLREHGSALHQLAVGVPRTRAGSHRSAPHRHVHRKRR